MEQFHTSPRLPGLCLLRALGVSRGAKFSPGKLFRGGAVPGRNFPPPLYRVDEAMDCATVHGGGGLAQTPLPPLPPWEVQSVCGEGGGLDHIWPKPGAKGARNFFFGIRWRVTIDFTGCIHTQSAQNFMGNSNVHAKQEKKLSPLTLPPLPPSPPPNWLRGPDPHFIFQKPHICVSKMISATRGSF